MCSDMYRQLVVQSGTTCGSSRFGFSFHGLLDLPNIEMHAFDDWMLLCAVAHVEPHPTCSTVTWAIAFGSQNCRAAVCQATTKRIL